MGALQKIAEDFNDPSSDDSTKLLSALEKVSEQEIYFVLTYSADCQSPLFKRQQALARMELDRRQSKSMEKLTLRTTNLAGKLGIFGAIAGGAAGALLTYLLA